MSRRGRCARVPGELAELITLGRTLKRRAADVPAYFDRPHTSNGPTESINGRLEHLRGTALGFRNLANYIARSLLDTGGFRRRINTLFVMSPLWLGARTSPRCVPLDFGWSPAWPHVYPVQATDDPGEIGVVDFVMVWVKLWDTHNALEQIAPMVGADTRVVSSQNGVLKEDLLTAAFGADRIVGGVAYIATSLSAPGVITETGPLEQLVFGELAGTTSSRVGTLLAARLAGELPPRSARTSRRRSGRSSCS